MDKIIITDEEVYKLVTLLNNPWSYGKIIELNGVRFEMNPTHKVPGTVFEQYLMGEDLLNYRKKIFTGRSLLQIKNAFIQLGFMDPIYNSNNNTSSFSPIKHEFDNICINRLFNMISNNTEKTNETSDKLNILVDVLDLKQAI